MLDIKFIRENKDIVKAGAKKKHIEFNLDELIEVDDQRLSFLREVEDLRSEQNKMNITMSNLKDDIDARQQVVKEMRILKEELKEKEEKLREIMEKWQKLMLQVPNVPDISVPEGESDADNQTIKEVGEKTKFDFEPKDHIKIMKDLDLVDFERGTKVHGFRGYYLKGDAVKLSFAIWNYALDFFGNKDFNLMLPPTVVKKSNFYGTGHLPSDVDDYYITQDDDGLVATSEISLMGYHSDEILNELPKKYLGFSPAYRREAGSHGKDVKGLIRVNEFYKFEQLIICEANHDVSVKYHEELNHNFEEFIESLELPYRTVINCGGDIGRGHVKMYDVETWIPKEEKYREIGSASYFHDFQCRRFNIRYKDEEGKSRYAHSLNATAIPTPRILVSLIENFQQVDGSIKIPEVLHKYFGKDSIK
ncbi:MAG: serine--tRNA ligase [Patescibacteria group bacterium]|nr:serine--tRNA ligase [Patescibacteria group bacterium]